MKREREKEGRRERRERREKKREEGREGGWWGGGLFVTCHGCGCKSMESQGRKPRSLCHLLQRERKRERDRESEREREREREREKERESVCVCERERERKRERESEREMSGKRVRGLEIYREHGRAGLLRRICLLATWDQGPTSLSGCNDFDCKPVAVMASRRWQVSWPAVATVMAVATARARRLAVATAMAKPMSSERPKSGDCQAVPASNGRGSASERALATASS